MIGYVMIRPAQIPDALKLGFFIKPEEGVTLYSIVDDIELAREQTVLSVLPGLGEYYVDVTLMRGRIILCSDPNDLKGCAVYGEYEVSEKTFRIVAQRGISIIPQ